MEVLIENFGRDIWHGEDSSPMKRIGPKIATGNGNLKALHECTGCQRQAYVGLDADSRVLCEPVQPDPSLAVRYRAVENPSSGEYLYEQLDAMEEPILTVEQRIEFHAVAHFFIQVGFDYEGEQYVVAITDRGRPDCGAVEGRGETLEAALQKAEARIGFPSEVPHD